jgi:hypothetical protein
MSCGESETTLELAHFDVFLMHFIGNFKAGRDEA